MSLLIVAYQNRSTQETITFSGKDSSGNAIQPSIGGSDKVRIKIGRAGSAPLIDLVSGSPLSTNGTQVTNANPATFTIVGPDFANIKPGVYDIEALVVDSADTNKTKLAQQGVFILRNTQSGNLGQP